MARGGEDTDHVHPFEHLARPEIAELVADVRSNPLVEMNTGPPTHRGGGSAFRFGLCVLNHALRYAL